MVFLGDLFHYIDDCLLGDLFHYIELAMYEVGSYVSMVFIGGCSL